LQLFIGHGITIITKIYILWIISLLSFDGRTILKGRWCLKKEIDILIQINSLRKDHQNILREVKYFENIP